MINKELIRQQIDELTKKENEIRVELRKYNDAIYAIQAICDHDPVYTGHGHNYSCYTCSVCDQKTEY